MEQKGITKILVRSVTDRGLNAKRATTHTLCIVSYAALQEWLLKLVTAFAAIIYSRSVAVANILATFPSPPNTSVMPTEAETQSFYISGQCSNNI